MDELDRLSGLIRDRGKIMVAFSGGVDSTLVALATRKAWGDQAMAVMVENETIPRAELEEAKKIAEEIGIRLEILKVDVLDDREITSNNTDRCGVCKKKLMSLLLKMAWAKGYDTLADGSNSDDVNDYRPGLEASDRLGVWHPLMEAGIGKEKTREILRQHSISVHDKPATTCLMTRIPYGEKITRQKL
ncbi:MAG: ATP-dependent sacrificial sulfur transferase LarE, partial [Thermoplasmatota archaeon]